MNTLNAQVCKREPAREELFYINYTDEEDAIIII